MSRAFIAFYMGDYDRDTQHLSTLEHGAYFLLLKHCWVHGSVPLSLSDRAQIAKVSTQKWYKIHGKIDAFFDDQGRNKRATKEIERAEKTSTRQTMAGHRGANKRWGKDGHGYTMANGHGHVPSDGHGMAIKKEDITTTSSVAAREGSAAEPVSKPVIPVTAELVASANMTGIAEKTREAVQKSTGIGSGELTASLQAKGWVP